MQLSSVLRSLPSYFSLNTFSKFSMGMILSSLALCGVGVESASANPITDALFWYDQPGSIAIRNEANTTAASPAPFPYLEYNITHGVHDANIYAFETFNAYGYKMKASKDFCSLYDHNFGYKNLATGVTTPFFAYGAPVGTQTTVTAPNANMIVTCMSGGQSYNWNSFPQNYPLIITGARYVSLTNDNYIALQFYCEETPPNPAFPSTIPIGYPVDFLDWRDHGYILEFIATQCNDRIDNDGDGVLDAADPGCWSNPSNPASYDKSRDSETSNTTQCQDGSDNDGDGVIDASDPGCWTNPTNPATYDRTRNNEAAATTQCQDGSDNDGDGVADAADPGCWSNPSNPSTYDRTRNNEAAATTQCQDGTDNDADGVSDAADPGCWTNPANSATYDRTRNNEAAATTQCQDNVDNDGDGVKDAADPGCWTNPANSATYDRTRNNEAAATTQCQDNVDNDGDGVKDAADPGCWTDPNNSATYDRTRNNEGAATTQCQDNVDNDGDGVKDAGDPGCWSDPSNPGSYDRTRNNEGAATTQCQDTRDNDGDSLVDAADPGCWTNPSNPASYDRTRNSEAGGTTQCQDGIDNDGDGVIDAADPGCWSNPSNPATYDRNRNNEAAATTQCQDRIDNDGDGVIDAADPGCWTNPANSATYDRTRNNEAFATTQCQDNVDNDGDGVKDSADPGCWSDPSNPSSYDPTRNNEGAATTQCQDRADNDADGLVDAADPGCWTNPNNSATYDRTRNSESSATSQCQDGRDNDGDGKVDMSDPGCSSPQDNTENSDYLPAPTGLQASDNDKNGISVTWTAVQGAATYDLYRSEDPNDFDPNRFVKIASVSTTNYYDTSAVPGRLYNYAVKAVNGTSISSFSNVDGGIRPSDVVGGDSDGDGVSDVQEGIDGTDPLDSGSFALHLKSPAFSKYNTFLSQLNFLELVGDGTLPVAIKVTVYSITGQPIATTQLSVAAQTQVDLDINTMVGAKDTYGVVKLEFRDDIDGATLKGRMSNYRPDPAATTYSFAFTKELRNPTRGDTYAGANSYDPQGSGFLVPNWMEVINLDSVDRTFAYTLYSQDGRPLQQQSFTLPPLGERDIQAGHEYGQGVYLGVVQPQNGETKYFAGISRYSSNSRGGGEAQTYNYAFNLEARAGNGSSQYSTIANEVGGCYTQTNWFEVTNVRSVPATAIVSFRDQNGAEIGRDSVVLNPKSQFHFNAGALLPKGTYGSVKLDSDLSGALISQSLVYYHDCSQNRVQTAYAVQSRIPGQDVQTGSVNSYIAMVNDLRLINGATALTAATVTVRPFGANPQTPAQFNLTGNSTLAVMVNGLNAAFPFPSDTYGTIKVQTAQPKKLIPFVLRTRPNPDNSGRMDFVIPVVIQ